MLVVLLASSSVMHNGSYAMLFAQKPPVRNRPIKDPALANVECLQWGVCRLAGKLLCRRRATPKATGSYLPICASKPSFRNRPYVAVQEGEHIRDAS